MDKQSNPSKRQKAANLLSQMNIPGKTDRPKKMIDEMVKSKAYDKIGASNPPNGPKKKK